MIVFIILFLFLCGHLCAVFWCSTARHRDARAQEGMVIYPSGQTTHKPTLQRSTVTVTNYQLTVVFVLCDVQHGV